MKNQVAVEIGGRRYVLREAKRSPLSDVRPGSRPWAPPLPVDFADRQYEGRTDGEW